MKNIYVRKLSNLILRSFSTIPSMPSAAARNAAALMALGFFCLSFCNNPKNADDRRSDNSLIQELLNETNNILENHNKGISLRRETTKNASAAIDYLNAGKVALLRMQRSITDSEAFTYYHASYKNLASLPLTEEGVDHLSRYFSMGSEFIGQMTNQLSLRSESIPWQLFTTEFSEGLKPFATFSANAPWITDRVLEKTFAEAEGWDNKSWLISPEFDLASISFPSLVMRHALIINRNTGRYAADSFDRSAIINNAFKLLVSENFDGENPDNATWEQIAIDGMPTGSEFHTVTTNPIDLKAFGNKKVSIALLFDLPSEIFGHHYVTWQVEEFSIWGVGKIAGCCDSRSENLFEYLFQDEKFDTFVNVNTHATSENVWTPFAIPNASIEFAKISALDGAADVWLMSPRFDLSTIEKPNLVIAETVRNPKWEDMQIMMSTDYDGADPDAATWIRLDRSFEPDPARAQDWADYNSTINLDKILAEGDQGRNVTIGFHFQSKQGEKHEWEIDTFTLKGKISNAEPGSELNYTLHAPVNAGSGTGTNAQGCKEPFSASVSYKHDFAKGMTQFCQINLSGQPANWRPKEFQGEMFIESSGHSPEGNDDGSNALISPAIALNPGAGDSHIQVSQIINFYNPPAQQRQFIKIRAAAVDSQPLDADSYNKLNWNILKFEQVPPGNSFDKVRSEWLKLPDSLQSAKKIVVSFEYTSDRGEAPRWQLFDLAVHSGEPPAVNNDNQGETNGPTELENILYRKAFDTENALQDFTQINISGSPDDWEANSHNEEWFADASGHRGPDSPNAVGTNSLVSPVIDINAGRSGKKYIQIDQLINHYFEAAQQQNFIRIVVAEADGVPANAESYNALNWHEMNFENVPPGTGWVRVKSEWLALPDTLQSASSIIIGLEYTSNLEEAPRWQVFELSVGSD